jgi:hypothetical protein
MNYFEFYDGFFGKQSKPVTQLDVIDWAPPPVNFEFHAGVCVERQEIEPRWDEPWPGKNFVCADCKQRR